MKKISKLMLGLGVAMAFASCANEEMTNPGATTDITVTVQTEGTALSRALATVDGYELKCVMQLVNDEGTTVGTQDIQPAADGSAAFTIKAADIDNGARKALFWAEYVPTAGATKVYNSDDLLNIKYNVTEFDASNADLIAAADAFAGTITTLTNGASVTLTRPMISMEITPTNPEVAAAASKLVVAYEAPSGYNVLTKNCNKDAYEALTFTNESFSSADEPWSKSFVLAPANLSKLDKAITMTLSGGFEKVINIEENKIPLDANYIIKADFELNATPGTQDVEVNVDLNGFFENEPKPAVFEIGAYVDAAGIPTNEVVDAVAVIYYVGAMETVYGNDNATLYPEQYAGKTIKGYAVALENTIKGRQQLNSQTIAEGLTANQELINGSVNTKTFIEHDIIGQSNMVLKYNDFVSAHQLSSVGTTTTDWYIPAQPQMQAWISMLYNTTPFPSGEAFGPTGTEDFKNLFPNNTIFDREPAQSCMYVTCSINTGSNVIGCSMTPAADNTPDNAKFGQVDIKTKTQSVLCRPMFTIFE